MQESTASILTVVGDILYLSAMPPQTPAMMRCLLERYMAAAPFRQAEPVIKTNQYLAPGRTARLDLRISEILACLPAR